MKLIVTAPHLEARESGLFCKCSRCRRVLAFKNFGVRQMPNGVVRNQPQCKRCRGRAPLPKRKR